MITKLHPKRKSGAVKNQNKVPAKAVIYTGIIPLKPWFSSHKRGDLIINRMEVRIMPDPAKMAIILRFNVSALNQRGTHCCRGME